MFNPSTSLMIFLAIIRLDDTNFPFMKEILSEDLLKAHYRIEDIISNMNENFASRDFSLSDFHSVIVKMHQISFDLKCISKYLANYE